jgi:hypothetical protein
MTYYLYKSPSGRPELLNYKIVHAEASGFQLIREMNEWVNTKFLALDSNNNLVSYETELTVQDHRRRNYPSIPDQLDALWHAMNNGTMPKAEPFYSKIKAVKDRFPKPSN